MATQQEDIQRLFQNCHSTIQNTVGRYYMQMQNAHVPGFRERMLQQQAQRQQQRELESKKTSPHTAKLLDDAYQKQQKTNRDSHNQRIKQKIGQKS